MKRQRKLVQYAAIKCAECGKVFKPISVRNKFHDRKCALAASNRARAGRVNEALAIAKGV
jgi:hypothetical protein